MILIADSGSTKCDWILTDQKGKEVYKSKTTGINPLILSESEIQNTIFQSDSIKRNKAAVRKIYFYGAGCGTEKVNKKLENSFRSVFKNSEQIIVEEDIVAAVHAATTKPGIIGILGTGSNCCYYDGEKVIQYTPSLGYILADEGSGNYLGKELLRCYYLHKMPDMLKNDFEKEFNHTIDELFQNLYNNSRPNKYLASYAVFIFKHRGHPFIEKILSQGITEFIDNHLMAYKKELEHIPIHFVGSIAYYAQDVITKLLAERGYAVKSFLKSPIHSLMDQILLKNKGQKTEIKPV